MKCEALVTHSTLVCPCVSNKEEPPHGLVHRRGWLAQPSIWVRIVNIVTSVMSIQLRRLFIAFVLSCTLAACSNDADQSGTAANRDTGKPRVKPEPGTVPTAGSEPRLAAPQTNADAQLLKDFKDRIDAYMKMHDKQEKGKADPKETSDPGKIKATQDALAAKIQAARKDAKPGDIFTPEIRDLFRRLIYPELKGPDAPETKTTIQKEDAGIPTKAEVLKVNAPYPEGKPLPTMPPNLLTRLPQLPEELEYRIINKDLILRDVNANLVVDFIPNAIR